MDGLWIINVNPPEQQSPSIIWFIVGGMAVVFAIAIVSCIHECGWPLDRDEWFATIISCAGMSMVGALLGTVVWAAALDDTKRSTTTYDVLISDEVKMNEFNEKYEIVSRNGNIYTIKEREK